MLDVTNTTLSVADYSTKDNLTLYPNPASTEINLSNTKDFISYEIYDASGRLIKEGFFDGKPIQINHLSNGVYTLSAKNKQGQTTSARFIKKK
ncbi:T9SS type A sorting domain-containing protein [Bergeyella porcorum]|uniref:T9SS type A sorting domain-containing protein n=1 Tax=Bergeyella porcorum TaxID=1735111 RepID=UPI0035EA123F